MFHCDGCGLCCKAVGLTETYRHLDRGDGICTHLDTNTNKCTIYERRPKICRVDELYESIFQEHMSLDEYYAMNDNACNTLKRMERQKMSGIKSALEEKFEEIFEYKPWLEDASWVRNAVDYICQGKGKKEDVIAIIDTSISNKGKSGLVLTTDSVCVKESSNFTTKFIARYEDIDYTYINEDRFLGVDITALELNMKYGTQYKISLDQISKRRLMEFLDYASSLYEEEDELVW
nr:YkgJ family cysteine cluster protein [Cytobacillus eiseniae]